MVQVGGLDSLLARVRNQVGQGLPDGVDWTSLDTTIVKVTQELTDSTAEIQGVAEGTAYVKAVSAVDGVRRDSVLVTVNNAPIVTQDSISALENVTDSIPAPRLQNNITAGGGNVVPGSSTTWAGGQAVVTAGGGLVYRAPAGYSGKDTVTYQVSDGTWTGSGKVVVQVEPTTYGYVRAGASGDGRDRSPFGTIAAAQAAAAAADSIFVLTPADNVSPVDGPAVLKNRQALIGQGVTFDVTRSLNGQTVMVFDGTGAAPGLTRTAAGPTVTVAEDNVIRGLGIGASAGAAIFSAAPFDSLFVRETDVSATGPALDLTTGDLDAVFGTLSAVNSASSGITLTGVTGSLTATGGAISITGAGGTAVSITGGVNVSYPGDVTQGTNNPLLAVANHTGNLTFGGTFQASSGTGVQFNNASGTYALNGAVNLAGGDAGLDVLSSGGVFSFADAAITSPSGGPAVNVVGGTPALVYRGSITHNSGRAVVVDGITADSVILRAAINSGTGASPTGLGILVQNVSGGRVGLDSVKTLFTGGNPAVTLTGNTGGLVRMGGGMAITTTSGAGFTASGTDTVTVTGNNTVSTGTGTAVSLTNVNTGSSGVSFSNVSTSGGAANGIVLSGITGAGMQATGGTISATTGAAVLLSNTSAADSVSLRNMTLGRSGAGAYVVSGTTFGKLHLLNTSLTGGSGAGALSLNGGTLSGSASGITALSATASPVSLTSVAGSLSVAAGNLSVAVGGSGAAMDVSGGSVSLTYTGDLTGLATTPLLRVANGHTGTLALNGGNSTAGTGSSGLRFENADGTYNVSVTSGTTTLAGDSAGIDILPGTDGTNGSQGTFQFGAPGNGFAITSGAGTAFNFQGSAADVTFHGGITRNGTQTGRMVDITGQRSASAITFQTGTLSATSSNAASTGILLSDADGTVSFSGTTTLNGGDAGIDVENGSAGTITFAGTSSVVNAAGELIRIVNSAPTFTYSGAFQRTTGNAIGILAQSNTGGTITFNGDGTTLDGDPADVTKSLSTGTGNAVSLVSNGGTTFHFAGGMTLATGTGTALNATGGGTITVTGAGNTVNTTGGSGVNIQNTTIGGSGVNLLSVTASGGANGIALVNTGAGGLQVTGGSTHGSGGTIANTTGADGAIAGNGVYLDNATNVNLSWMNFSGHANHAVRGTGVSNVTLTRLRITGTNGTNAGSDEGSISFTNLTGAAAINASYIEGGFEDNVRVANTSGTLNRLVMNNDTIGHNGNSGNDGVLLDGAGTATLNVTVQNSRFTGSRSNNVHYVLNNDAAGDFVFTGNVVTNNHPAKLGSDFGINVGSTSNGAMTYTISSNSVNDAGGSGIEVSHLAGGSGAMTGSITNNTVGTAGVSNSGSSAGSTIVAAIVGAGTTATHNTTITGNTLRQYTNYGIRLINRGTGNGYLNAVVKTNNIAQPSPNAAAFAAYSGIRAELGASSVGPDDGRTCLDISGNTLNQTGSSLQADLRVFARFGTRTSLLGLGQGGASSDPNTFLNNQNTITVAPGGFGAVNATSTNPFQSSCPPV
ncbi:MAG TPA: Ig-like domain-containing protein [Longimicrobium sp.]